MTHARINVPSRAATRAHLTRRAALFALVCAGTGAVRAQEIRNPLRIVVGYPAGGTADAAARLFADSLRTSLGVAVIIENRTGAGGQIAAETFARQAPDNATLLLANSHMLGTLPLISRNVRYDPAKDFAPVSLLGYSEIALAVHSSVQAETLAQYVKLAREQPQAAMVGIPAPGSSPQFVSYVIGQKEGIKLTAVPYRGGAPLVTDLLGGQILAGIDTLGSFIEHHKSGRIRVLALSGTARSAQVPSVPTLVELGYPQLDRSSWIGLFAPAGSAGAFVQRIAAAVAEAAREPRIVKELAKLGIVAASSPPQALLEAVRAEAAVWGPIIKASGYQAD